MVGAASRGEHGRDLTKLVALAMVYVAVGYAGVRFANLAGAVTLFWPPAGIGVGITIRHGRRGLLTCALAALALNVLLTRTFPFAIAAAAANTIEAALAALVFHRFADGRSDLARPLDAGGLVIAGAAAALVAALVGSLSVVALLPAARLSFLALYATWWLGDVAGVILVAAPVLSFTSPSGPDPGRSRGAPSMVVTVAMVVLAVAIAAIRIPEPPLGLPLALVEVVAVVFAAFRFGTRGAHASALAIATAAFVGTFHDRGPFFMGNREHSEPVLWAAIVLLGGASLFVSSLIAERAASEIRLVESERQLRALFDNAPNGMLLLDSHRKIVLANRTALEMAGRTDLGIPDSFELLVGPDTSELREAIVRAVARGDRIVEARMRKQDDRGELREFVVRTSLLGEKNTFDGAVVLVEDITEREAERREREEIEHQLAAAQRLESIGNLAGGIAHDFNNMLQAIRANLELATIASRKGKDAAANIDRALSAADRATSLTRQLLAFSRRQPARFDRVEVVGLLRSALALLERLLPEDIHLVFDPKASGAWVRGDHAQLEQVLLNLVVNARDAMPQGGTLRIETETQPIPDSEFGLVRIAVSDEGTGVDPTIRDRIFEPFFTTKPTGRGTGLGLAVVYGIVKSHGGSVHVETVAGGGARFVVELPWLDSPDSAVDASEPEGIAPEGHGERILLVEDDPLVRMAVRDMLVASGYEVVVASNGADAVGFYRSQAGEFDLVILDVVMPVMGGREAYEKLREIDPDVNVVFATGYSEEQIDVGFVLRERVPVITKPFNRTALLGLIAQVVPAKHSSGVEVVSAG